MFKKISIIIQNFFKTTNYKEVIELFVVPIIITIIFFVINGKINNLENYISNFSNSLITITSLLVAFGVASLSILATSGSETITTAKKYMTRRKDRNNNYISYYKLLVIRNLFSLIYLSILLLAAISVQFLANKLSYNIVAYLEFYFLIVGIFIEIFVITSLYFLFSKE